MPVPLTGSIKADDIRNAVIEGGGSVSSHSFDAMRMAADINLFHPDWKNGATSLTDIKTFEQWRGYPYAGYGNDAYAQDFIKECSDGGSGSSVTYHVPKDTYFATSKSAANAMAVAQAAANGQAHANTHGICTWWNDARGAWFTKSCSDGGSGSSVYYGIDAGTISSNISKADANSQAQNQVDSNGQSHANTHGSCTWYSDFMSIRYYKECENGGSGSPFDYQLPAGYYSSNNSKSEANDLAYAHIIANGQSAANSAGVCTWCSEARGHYVRRNNCAAGYQGEWYLINREHCAFTSNVSKLDAESKLNDWFNGSEAQNLVNMAAGCVLDCPSIPSPSISLSYVGVDYDRDLYIVTFHNRPSGASNVWNVDIYTEYPTLTSTGPGDPFAQDQYELRVDIGGFAQMNFFYKIGNCFSDSSAIYITH